MGHGFCETKGGFLFCVSIPTMLMDKCFLQALTPIFPLLGRGRFAYSLGNQEERSEHGGGEMKGALLREWMILAFVGLMVTVMGCSDEESSVPAGDSGQAQEESGEDSSGDEPVSEPEDASQERRVATDAGTLAETVDGETVASPSLSAIDDGAELFGGESRFGGCLHIGDA